MSAKTKYTDEPFGNPKVIKDFLPSPDELAFSEEVVKVTIALSKKSVEFFKSQAEKHHTQYQRMIRRLIDAYVENYASDIANAPVNRTPESGVPAERTPARGRRLPSR